MLRVFFAYFIVTYIVQFSTVIQHNSFHRLTNLSTFLHSLPFLLCSMFHCTLITHLYHTIDQYICTWIKWLSTNLTSSTSHRSTRPDIMAFTSMSLKYIGQFPLYSSRNEIWSFRFNLVPLLPEKYYYLTQFNPTPNNFCQSGPLQNKQWSRGLIS